MRATGRAWVRGKKGIRVASPSKLLGKNSITPGMVRQQSTK